MTDPYAAPEWYDPSTLVRRLGGVYDIPIDDGCGPIDGKMVFTRDFNEIFVRPQIQLDAAQMIIALEKGEMMDSHRVLDMIDELKKPADPLNIGKKSIVPIHCEVIARLKELAGF